MTVNVESGEVLPRRPFFDVYFVREGNLVVFPYFPPYLCLKSPRF